MKKKYRTRRLDDENRCTAKKTYAEIKEQTNGNNGALNLPQDREHDDDEKVLDCI